MENNKEMLCNRKFTSLQIYFADITRKLVGTAKKKMLCAKLLKKCTDLFKS